MAKKKVTDNTIFDFNAVQFFITGKKEPIDNVFIDGDVLYAWTNPKKKRKQGLGVKSNGFLMINGDDISRGEGSCARDDLQYGNKKEITTSFDCLGNAGLDLKAIKVIQITQDLSRSIQRGSKGFKDFEVSVPQGATYSEDIEDTVVTNKSYHRAGSMLIRHKDVSYICGMDGESYFVSKLKTNPKNVDAAFKSLKPKRVVDYEKRSGRQALRQGEWFFIPAPDVDVEEIDMKTLCTLPLQTKKSNEHSVDRYKKIKDRHYCRGYIVHPEHSSLRLPTGQLYEAIENTAQGSWSVQGVD